MSAEIDTKDLNFSHDSKHDHATKFRKRRVIDGHRETFEIGAFSCQQDKSIEQVKYSHNPENDKSERIVIEIEYEGWRRHVAERQQEEGARITFHVSDLLTQAKIARLIEGDEFKKIGWMEPICAVPEDPTLTINFCEKKVETDPDYLDELFQRIGNIEEQPIEILIDLKTVNGLNCVYKFIEALKTMPFEDARNHLKSSALRAITSPFFAAALYCKDKGMLLEARCLLTFISKEHWQFDEAIILERTLYEQEIQKLKDELLRVRMQYNTPIMFTEFSKENTSLQETYTPSHKGLNQDVQSISSDRTNTQEMTLEEVKIKFKPT